jgi:uncharacterized protein YjbI with pentapeptide repeats
MANPEHLAILKQGVEVWNKWRDENENSNIEPDLSEANLIGAVLNGAKLTSANLSGANLSRATFIGAYLNGANINGGNLSEAILWNAILSRAKLSGAILNKAYLRAAILLEANLSGADLSGACLDWANLYEANLSGANLIGASLQQALLVSTKFNGADLSGCNVFGISAWRLELQGAIQSDLVITPDDEPTITVDNLEVAQFVYLLLNNEKIRNVIDTIGKKGVLILGRFTKERKAVLDAIRNKLRELGFVPMMFDFEKPTQRDFTETIKTLAGLSRFIIADITNPKSSPLELQATMPDYMIPFVPIIQEDEKPFAMFQDLKQKYGEWVLDPLEYDTAQGLLDVFDEAVAAPANEMAGILELKKAEQIRTRHVKDYRKG